MIERSETLQIMDQLEALVLKKGWPVPFTPYYLIHHEKLLALMDQLRASLQDEMDGRFITAFANAEAENKPYQQPKNKGKERSH
jgi:hypothetical protein